LVIQLTIDPELQMEAAHILQSAVAAASPRKKQLQGALVCVDRAGEVRALIGGASYAQSKFNRATQAIRQPGSAFKAFVYAAALEQGLDGDTVRYDEPITIEGWSPKNYDEGYRGAVTLRTALAQSLNTVAVEVADEVGQSNVVELAQRFGINTKLMAVPSIALGSSEVTLFDMAQAFSVFMRDGARIDSHLVREVRDTRGRPVYQRGEPAPRQVFDVELSHQMTGMLGRVLQNGTGVRARLAGREAAGKTGTSQDWRDAWFVGYTHDFTAGVWVGYDDYTPMARVTGGGPPAEIWSQFMAVAHRGVPATKLAGILPPETPRTIRQQEKENFYDALTAAFGGMDEGAPAPEPEPSSGF
jgi:penicillin-binding protein 1A